jgi:hypothetical protein
VEAALIVVEEPGAAGAGEELENEFFSTIIFTDFSARFLWYHKSGVTV